MTRHPLIVQPIAAAPMLIGAALIESAHDQCTLEQLAVPLPLLAVVRHARSFPLPGVGRAADEPRNAVPRLRAADDWKTFSETRSPAGKQPKMAQKPMEKHQPIMVVNWW